uniref:Secreted protein n=1 Tax=Populus trichocarpa TaxID=3694 RepID=A0A3N7FT34_POPTR
MVIFRCPGTDLPRLKHLSLLLLLVDADCIYKSSGICDVFQADGLETRVLISCKSRKFICLLIF